MGPSKLRRTTAVSPTRSLSLNLGRSKTLLERSPTQPSAQRPLSKRKSQFHWVRVARWGRPSTCTEDTCRPWPVGVLRPSDLSRASPRPYSPPPSPALLRGGRGSPERCVSRASAGRATPREEPPQDLGAGHLGLRQAALALDSGLRNLQVLLDELTRNYPAWAMPPFDQHLVRAEIARNFLRQGGDVPAGLALKRTCHVAGGFAAEVTRYIGSFLVAKQGSGPPRPRRAVWAIRGLAGGRIALQRLTSSAVDDAEIRKLGTADSTAVGGFSADPVELQRLCWMITPETMISWATEVLAGDVPQCLRLAEQALREAFAEQQRLAEEARLQEEYERKVAYRLAWRQRRGPLVRELWAALWNSATGRVQSVFFAMKRVDIYPSDKMFHLVTVQGSGESYVVLEPSGAIAEEADVVLNSAEQAVRRHAAASALEAYECMRLDDKAPPGRADLHKWLQDECGPPSRTDWCARRFQACPGRNLMMSLVFEQLVLTDLIAEALEVEIPGQEKEAEDVYMPMAKEASAPFLWPETPGCSLSLAALGEDAMKPRTTPKMTPKITLPSSSVSLVTYAALEEEDEPEGITLELPASLQQEKLDESTFQVDLAGTLLLEEKDTDVDAVVFSVNLPPVMQKESSEEDIHIELPTSLTLDQAEASGGKGGEDEEEDEGEVMSKLDTMAVVRQADAVAKEEAESVVSSSPSSEGEDDALSDTELPAELG